MKILRNIPMVYKFYIALPSLKQYKKGIFAAREAGDLKKEREYILKATSDWGKTVMDIFKTQVIVTGTENIPVEGPVVYVANHQGYADIPICCFVLDKIQLGFIAREDLKNVPLYGEWINNIRSVMIRREDPREALRAIDKGIALINQGFSLLVFPEGTRSKGGPMRDFKKGSLKLATKPGVPIVPVTINGSWRIFEEKGYPQKATVHVTVHPAVPTAGLARDAQNELHEKIQSIVASALTSSNENDQKNTTEL